MPWWAVILVVVAACGATWLTITLLRPKSSEEVRTAEGVIAKKHKAKRDELLRDNALRHAAIRRRAMAELALLDRDTEERLNEINRKEKDEAAKLADNPAALASELERWMGTTDKAGGGD